TTAAIASSRANARPAVIKVIAIDTSDHPVDVAPKGPSVGDRDLGTERLVNALAQFGKPKGSTVGSEISSLFVTGPKSFNVVLVSKLPGGLIRAEGPVEMTGG